MSAEQTINFAESTLPNGLTIRQATEADAAAWVDLLQLAFEGYPDQQVFDPAWAAAHLQGAEAETWVAEENGVIQSVLSFLLPGGAPDNPVANIGRHFNRPEAFQNGAAALLLGKAVELATERGQLAVSRVLASDLRMQQLYEEGGFVPVGFQLSKHAHRMRESAVFYSRLCGLEMTARVPIAETLPQIAELAQQVLRDLNFAAPTSGRDGLTGYPLQSEFEFMEGTSEDFDLWRQHAQTISGIVEVSGGYNRGLGFLRTVSSDPPAAVFAVQEGTVLAGLLCVADPVDHCVRVVDSFSMDEFSLGPLLNELTKRSLQDAGMYVEVDILGTAPRLLKTADQIGFVPVAYFPAIYAKGGGCTDVVKLVKQNTHFTLDNTDLTPAARRVAELISQNHEDQKVGLAIVNLLRGLPFFQGLGDGELRKIARLFIQKMFRAGDTIFKKGEYSYDAYVVMRGQVDIVLNEDAPPLVQIGNGEIFGELAFLDATPRSASAIASQTTIALVIQRSAFNDLARREPHLGMVVVRNIALELSKRLRKSNESLTALP